MKKPETTIILKMSKSETKWIHDRISVFLDKYNNGQLMQTKHFDVSFINDFDIKTLCYSCYSQGLADAKEALNYGKESNN